MTEQQNPKIEPGLRVRYRADAAGLNMLAGDVREVSSLADGMVEVVDPERPDLGVMNAEGEGIFWSVYEPVSTEVQHPFLPTREQIAEAKQREMDKWLSDAPDRERAIAASWFNAGADAVLALLQKGAER